MVLHLLSLGKLGCVEMATVQIFPWYQHVTYEAARMGDIYFFHYDHGVPNLAVQEVHPKTRPGRRLYMTYLHRACQLSHCPQE